MTSVRTETETVIKRIIPYLRRRGYDPETDIDFETPVQNTERYTKGYVDLLVNCGASTPMFVIEAKRNGKTLTAADAKQARAYGVSVKAPFVVVTNGSIVQVFNTATGDPLRWNGRLADKIPSKDQLPAVVKYLRQKKDSLDVPLGKGDVSLPFRPALPLKQLNELFSRCHNKIRNIEKNEENAFADFSKILFLKLLEEKSDAGDFNLPYSFRFWELAEKTAAQADQVKSSILNMLSDIKKMGYGDVLTEELHLKNPATYRYIVGELAKVSFSDSDLDVKGTAFEYFVRATLKGKKLGQYFTPRPVVEVMADLVGSTGIVASMLSGTDVRVLDPACGTGGFLVYLLKSSLADLDDRVAKRKITKPARDNLTAKLKKEVFHGGDANDGVASAAKMNMIIAGDGHNNIVCENSVLPSASIWPIGEERYDYILTNPPFGTAEGDSLSAADAALYPVPGGKGQHLFLQRMVMATKPGGYVCTVIDDGLLNTDTGVNLRRWIMQNVELMAVVQLPTETFKPNKINVRSSLLLMRKRDTPDIDLLETYPIAFGEIESLGYVGSGDPIRGFDLEALKQSFSQGLLDPSLGSTRTGIHWNAFDVQSADIVEDGTVRWDRKYWLPEVRLRSEQLCNSGAQTLGALNTIKTRRGKSPATSLYVDEQDGYAVVVKAGSCITKFGQINLDGADWIEKSTYDDTIDAVKLKPGDVVIASTGDGTLGKAAVWTSDLHGIADGHVTIVRIPESVMNPAFLADYLRAGFGNAQVQRLYTGSTGLIELTPEHVNRIVVPLMVDTTEQDRLSARLRDAENVHQALISDAEKALREGRLEFAEKASADHAI